MTGGESNNNSKPPHKAYGITNIKTYVPLILDFTTQNYEPWSALFKVYCTAYDIFYHVDGTYDAPNRHLLIQNEKDLT